MSHHSARGHRQQTQQQRCTICVLFQSMGKGQYRSSYDREMYLHHLQIAHGVKLGDQQGNNLPTKGDVLKE
jgi:hypothetical protein